MTQNERRVFLIGELLKEGCGKRLGIDFEGGSFVIPEDVKSQQDILRALMNMREPLPCCPDCCGNCKKLPR